jgi:hypothetical protein
MNPLSWLILAKKGEQPVWRTALRGHMPPVIAQMVGRPARIAAPEHRVLLPLAAPLGPVPLPTPLTTAVTGAALLLVHPAMAVVARDRVRTAFAGLVPLLRAQAHVIPAQLIIVDPAIKHLNPMQRR